MAMALNWADGGLDELRMAMVLTEVRVLCR
jgi:hypothetical protein